MPLSPELISLLKDVNDRLDYHAKPSPSLQTNNEALIALCERQAETIAHLQQELDHANAIIRALATLSATTEKQRVESRSITPLTPSIPDNNQSQANGDSKDLSLNHQSKAHPAAIPQPSTTDSSQTITITTASHPESASEIAIIEPPRSPESQHPFTINVTSPTEKRDQQITT